MRQQTKKKTNLFVNLFCKAMRKKKFFPSLKHKYKFSCTPPPRKKTETS